MLIMYQCMQWFLLFSILISIFGVISRRFLMEKIFNLIAVFITLAFWLMLAGLEFLPLVILLLYVGAIAVLFLFVVMIVNPDYHDILEDKKTLYTNWNNNHQTVDNKLVNVKKPLIYSFKIGSVFGSMGGLVYFLFGLFFVILSGYLFDMHSLINVNIKSDLFTLPLKHNVGGLDMLYIADLLYHDYSLSLLIIGFMLLVSMIGVIILTLKQSIGLKRQNISSQFFRYR